MIIRGEARSKQSGGSVNYLFPHSCSSVRASDDFNTPHSSADCAFCSDFCFYELNSVVDCFYNFSLQNFVIIFSVREGKQMRSVAIAQLALPGVLDFVTQVS